MIQVMLLAGVIMAAPATAGPAELDPAWISYANGTLGLFAFWGPERMMLVNPADFGISYPFQIDSLKVRFYDMMGSWTDSVYRFRIYGADGQTLLFESEDLIAPRSLWFTYTLPTPLRIDAGNFYFGTWHRTVSAPYAYPYMTTDDNEGANHCYYGSAGSWTRWPDGWGELYFFWAFTQDAQSTHDVGCSYLLAPAGTVDSAALVAPACSVYNYGNAAENYKVRMRIGGLYDSTFQVNGHGPGARLLVEFPAWTALPRGASAVTCSTELTGDAQPGNDAKSGTVFVRVRDAEAVEVLAPGGVVDSGAVIAPRATVRNRGTQPETFDVRFEVADGFTNTQPVADLGAGETREVSFDDWTALSRGSWQTKCSTRLDNDRVNGNDLATGLVDVRVIDVGAFRILAPAGTIDSGQAVVPACSVYNYGTTTESYDARMTAGAFYDETEPVASHAPGTGRYVEFPSHAAWPRGTHPVTAWTWLDTDANHANDSVSGLVSVRVQDVAVTSITVPSGIYTAGESITPEAVWRNHGTVAADFEAWVALTDPGGTRTYSERVNVAGLAAGADTSVDAFPSYQLLAPGVWQVRCSTYLAGDLDRSNDVLDGAFTVVSGGTPDVGITALLAPSGEIDTGQAIVPQSRAHNFGDVNLGFTAWFMVSDTVTDQEVYRQSIAVSGLEPGADSTLSFPVWPGTAVEGPHLARCSLAINDHDPANDTLSLEFLVRVRGWPTGWREVRSLPDLPSNRLVKDGAWLAATGSAVYAARGNKTTDFLCYDPAADTWQELASIDPDEGGKFRPPRKGCVGASDGESFVYMTKGNNTFGFWQYDIMADTWARLADVPSGPSGRKVKGGNDLAYVVDEDTGWVYLLKGYRNEFYRYNVQAGRWDTLDNAPFGGRLKYGEGSFLAYDGDRTIYCHQAKYHDGVNHYMFKYDSPTQYWFQTSLAGMPLLGMYSGRMKSKKSKDGAAGAWYDGAMCALKGGNTGMFYRYEPASADSWSELDTMPSYGSSERSKRVKQGGDLVAFGNGTFFALKGNKTNEFWRYVQPTAYSSQPTAQRSGVAADGRLQNADCRMQIAPSPIAAGYATINYSLPKAGPVSLTMFDVSSRTVLRQTLVAPKMGATPLELGKLANGVYLVRIDAQGYSHSQKLVVQR